MPDTKTDGDHSYLHILMFITSDKLTKMIQSMTDPKEIRTLADAVENARDMEDDADRWDMLDSAYHFAVGHAAWIAVHGPDTD